MQPHRGHNPRVEKRCFRATPLSAWTGGTMDPEKSEFPQESHAGRRKRLGAGRGACFLRRFSVLRACQITLQDESGAQTGGSVVGILTLALYLNFNLTAGP